MVVPMAYWTGHSASGGGSIGVWSVVRVRRNSARHVSCMCAGSRRKWSTKAFINREKIEAGA
ncbi:MAG: hypothetical protein MZU97_00210 [Bacillus subtilis]|nr:hypothetical protein [Bacillus subtilis]